MQTAEAPSFLFHLLAGDDSFGSRVPKSPDQAAFLSRSVFKGARHIRAGLPSFRSKGEASVKSGSLGNARMRSHQPTAR